MEIEVVDEIMGSGKSHAVLRYIESLALKDKSEKWVFCTEYLNEIEQRTQENPQASHLWKTPIRIGDDNKTDNFKELLSEPDVQLIGITHSLLVEASKDTYVNFLLKSKGYKLFLDETIDLINPYNGVLVGNFFIALKRKDLSVDDSNYGAITWNTDIESLAENKETAYDKLIYDCGKGTVFCSINSGSAGNEDSLSIVHIEKEVIFTQFNRVLVATYQIENTLFDAYLNIKGMVRKRCTDVVCYKKPTKLSIAEKIEFISKHDKVFKSNYDLSSKWYNSKGTAEDYKAINKIIKDVGDKSGCKGNAHLLGFTVPADKLGKQRDTKRIQPVGYPHTVCSVVVDAEGNEVTTNERDKAKSAYIPCNARASNDYAHKVVMIHAFNRYPVPAITNFLSRYDVSFSAERFALNEIIQWVWRCAIRKGDPIKLAILSPRMRGIFKGWLNDC